MLPKISIIVPVYNGEKTLPLCLDSLMNLDYPRKDLEIIVVDNNSTDSTKSIIEQYPVKYIFELKRNRSVARNKGIKESSGELLSFLDADCIAHKDWIKNLMEGFKEDNVGGCGGKILFSRSQSLIERYLDFIGFYSQEEKIFGKESILQWIMAANSVYRRKVLYDVGLFDEFLNINEDMDLSWRVCLKGYQLKYVPEAIVYHNHCYNIVSFFKKYFESGYASAWLSKRYKFVTKRENLPTSFFKWFLLFRQSGHFKNIFLKATFVSFDIIVRLTFLSGKICGLIRLKSKKRKIHFNHFHYNKIIWWEADDKTFLLNPADNFSHRYCLNSTGGRLWQLIAEKKNDDEIINRISNEYEVDKEEIESDLASLKTDLKNEDLLI